MFIGGMLLMIVTQPTDGIIETIKLLNKTITIALDDYKNRVSGDMCYYSYVFSLLNSKFVHQLKTQEQSAISPLDSIF